jgi:DNA-binding response OmpR family regulator
VAGIANEIPELEVDADDGAELLVLGWGSTFGAIKGAVRRVRKRGGQVARAHLYHLEDDIYRTYDLGVSSYITKPVTFTELVEMVQTLSKYWFEIVELPPARFAY